jgi:hypothetical protein
VAPPHHNLGHCGKVGNGDEAQERGHHGFRERDGGEHQHAQGGDGCDQGKFPADTHVAHGINHPRGWIYFRT